MGKILRRTFLLGAGAVAGGLAVGYYLASRPHPNPLEAGLGEGESSLNPYVVIGSDGAVTVIVPRAEMGQGVHTTLAALVAEELGIPLDAIRVEHGPASGAYYNEVLAEANVPYPDTAHGFVADTMRDSLGFVARAYGLQATGGSTSVRDGFDRMRRAGAAARHLLFEAAARELEVSAADLVIAGHQIVAPDGRHVAIGAVAAKAAEVAPPGDVALKDPKDWTILGRPQKRTDLKAKVTGAPVFGIDVDLPDMVHGTVRMNPRRGAGIRSADTAKAEAIPGVIKVIRLDTPTGTGFGVIARDTWTAFKAAEAIDVDWDEAPYPRDTDTIMAAFRKTLDGEAPGSAYRDDGDATGRLAEAPRNAVVRADYSVPYLAHATMEPMNATAQFADGKLTLWAPNQSPTVMKIAGSSAAGISGEDVTVHTTLLGGGFGRRAEPDVAFYAARLAMEADGRPVKVTWTREEDMSHDTYRPAAMARCRAVRDADGLPAAIDIRVATPSIMKSMVGRIYPSVPVAGPERLLTEGAFDQPYIVPDYRVAGVEVEMPIPVGYWRSVGYSFNCFFQECFLDEIAASGGQDPIDLRLALMKEHPEAAAVMKKLAGISEWSTALPEGRAKGVAFAECYGSRVGQVIQVARSAYGIRIEKVWAVADVGIALDPGIIEQQLASGIVFGLSAALGQQITFSGGEAEQRNFYDYDAMRINQSPEFSFAVLENGSAPGGVGEIGTPPSAPALANAVYALTGKRIRSMPLSKEVEFA